MIVTRVSGSGDSYTPAVPSRPLSNRAYYSQTEGAAETDKALPYSIRAMLLLAVSLVGLVVGVALLFVTPTTTATSMTGMGVAPFEYQDIAAGTTVDVRLTCLSPWRRLVGPTNYFPLNPYEPYNSYLAYGGYPGFSHPWAEYNLDEQIVDSSCSEATDGQEALGGLVAVPSLALGVIVGWKGWRRPSERIASGTDDDDADQNDETPAPR